MLHFEELKCGGAELISALSRNADEDTADILAGIYAELCEVEETGVSCALAEAGGCLLIRVLDDGSYAFPYPFPLSEDADTHLALLTLSDYMRRELLPPILTDVPREELECVRSVFHRVDAAAYPDDEDSFYIRAVSECEGFQLDVPLCGELISLDEWRDRDAPAFFELATDPRVNAFWGYDYREDDPDPKEDFFLSVARAERGRGIALSLCVRLGDEAVGEAVLFDFDYRGSAEAAVRLRRDVWGRGIGSDAVRLLLSVAERLGLSSVRAEVMRDNAASRRMTERIFDLSGESEDRIYYVKELLSADE